MAHAPDPDTVFTKPDAPRSDWELFKWMFFEPTLLKRYSLTISRRQTVWPMLRMYVKYVVPLVLIAYPLWITVIIAIDSPNWSPELFRFHRDTWQSLRGFGEQWLFLARELILELACVLTSILAIGLVLRKVEWLAFVLLSGLTLLAGGLAGGLLIYWAVGLWVYILVGGLLIGLLTGLIGDVTTVNISLNVRLAGGLVLGFGMGIAVGVGIGVNMGLAVGVGAGAAFGVGLCLGFYISQFRFLFYPFHYHTLFEKNTLTQNPYLHNETIILPLPWVKNSLRREAATNPELAFQFIDFLLRYRPLQLGFAAELEHIATAARWQSALRLRSSMFEKLRFFKDEEVPKKWAKHTPSAAWRNQLGELRDTLHLAEAQTAVVLKKDYYEQCATLLEEIEKLLLRETFLGRDTYFPIIAYWKKALQNQLQEVYQEVARVQTVTSNPYVKGYALSPDVPGNVPVFLDRNDVKEELALKILTSVSMPTFLILGQRRVGKTSLLNFLPTLLDPASFAVASMDAQSMSGELSVPKWLREWRYRVTRALGSESDTWEPPEDWLEAWDAFADSLRLVAQGSRRRLILAMDEYDEEFGFHHALQQDPTRAAAFLSRMRAFSQSEKKVVFLFVGATSFSDLPEPKWSKYFVHAHIVRVDYLSKPASLQLIERPVPGFNLRYEPGLPQHIYELTQGHPHLLHSICSDLVDYANAATKNPVGFNDLEKILREKTVLRDEQPFILFWDEFCVQPAMREAVLAIVKRQPVDNELPEVRRLLEYRYIVQDEERRCRMRVPLFEEWVLKFGY